MSDMTGVAVAVAEVVGGSEGGSEGGQQPGKYPLLDDAAWVRQKYEGEGLSMKRIGRLAGCPEGSAAGHVRQALGRHGIAARKPGRRPGSRVRRGQEYPLLEDAAWVRQKYEGEGLTVEMVGLAAGCPAYCAIPLARQAMQRHGIRRRPSQGGKPSPRLACLRDPEWLRQAYDVDRLSVRDIAARAGGCSPGTVWAALKRAGITRRRKGRKWNNAAGASLIARLRQALARIRDAAGLAESGPLVQRLAEDALAFPIPAPWSVPAAG